MSEALRSIVEGMRKLRPERRYSCHEDFVLQHGRPYVTQSRPKKYRKGTPRLCYANSGRLALRHNLLYVEGYVHLPDFPQLPIHHAWCVERGDDKAIDVTTNDRTERFARLSK